MQQVLDDERWAAEAVAGSAEAFAALVQRHADSLWRLAMSRLGDAHEAEDATQETFLRAWRALDGWRGEAALRTWLHTICRNVCTDRLRRRREVVSLDRLREAGAEPDPLLPASDGRSADRAVLGAALAVLSDDEREAFVLVDVLGFSGEDAAGVCEVPATTLRSRLHRAHRKLVTALGEDER